MEIVINFSGGKDSSAMLAYICEKYPDVKKHVVFADTGWEHTDAEQWSRQIVALFGLELHVVRNPNKTFLSMSEKRGKFPGMQTRQCTSDLKRDPINAWIRKNVKDAVVVNCMGLRAEESSARAKKKRLGRNNRETNSKRTLWDWLPIQEWTETEVLAYLEKKGIPLHPVYKHLRRFSCRVCIYMSQHDVAQVAKFDPQAIDIIEKIEKATGFTMFQKAPIRSYAAAV
jgi:3'-phosphoadenosine 5'-phosphosulfate sulfotransferase (PAPS reductase)/FAD synthetase